MSALVLQIPALALLAFAADGTTSPMQLLKLSDISGCLQATATVARMLELELLRCLD